MGNLVLAFNKGLVKFTNLVIASSPSHCCRKVLPQWSIGSGGKLKLMDDLWMTPTESGKKLV